MSTPTTLVGSVTWDQAAYERLAYFALRPMLYVDPFADVKPTNQSMPGSSVIFNLTSDLSVASSAINSAKSCSSAANSPDPRAPRSPSTRSSCSTRFSTGPPQTNACGR